MTTTPTPLDLKRLYQSFPNHLQKKVSFHDLKLICDAYNGDQPPIDNGYVKEGCEKFGDTIPTPRVESHLRCNTGNGRQYVTADFARQLEQELTKLRVVFSAQEKHSSHTLTNSPPPANSSGNTKRLRVGHFRLQKRPRNQEEHHAIG